MPEQDIDFGWTTVADLAGPALKRERAGAPPTNVHLRGVRAIRPGVSSVGASTNS